MAILVLIGAGLFAIIASVPTPHAAGPLVRPATVDPLSGVIIPAKSIARR
jgi:hypothetical protein